MNEVDTEALIHIGTGELESGAVVVRVGTVEFGLPVALVSEVLHVPPITRLPFSPKSVPGVVSVRSAVLPVIDLGDRLFDEPSSRDGRLVIATDRHGGSEVALLVDAVADLISTEERVEEPPEIAASLPAGWIVGVISPSADRLVTLLDLEKVLARNEDPHEESR